MAIRSIRAAFQAGLGDAGICLRADRQLIGAHKLTFQACNRAGEKFTVTEAIPKGTDPREHARHMGDMLNKLWGEQSPEAETGQGEMKADRTGARALVSRIKNEVAKAKAEIARAESEVDRAATELADGAQVALNYAKELNAEAMELKASLSDGTNHPPVDEN